MPRSVQQLQQMRPLTTCRQQEDVLMSFFTW
jgi:hypothetical protein